MISMISMILVVIITRRKNPISHDIPITMVYGIYNQLVTGVNINQQTYLGGLTIVWICTMIEFHI